MAGAALFAAAVPLALFSLLRARVQGQLEPTLTRLVGHPVTIGGAEADLTGAFRLRRITIDRFLAADEVEIAVSWGRVWSGAWTPSQLRIHKPRLSLRAERLDLVARLLNPATRSADGEKGRGAATPSPWPRLARRGPARPQARALRLLTDPLQLELSAGPYLVRGSFSRAASDIALPSLAVERLAAIGGRLAISAGNGTAVQMRDVVLRAAAPQGGKSRLSLRFAGGEEGGLQVDLEANRAALSLRFHRMPLAILSALLPQASNWIDLSGAAATGRLRIEAGASTRWELDAAVRRLLLTAPRLAREPVPLSSQIAARVALPAPAGRRERNVTAIAVEQFRMATGSLAVLGSGYGTWEEGHSLPRRGLVSLVVPPVSCALALASLPLLFRDRLTGMRLGGTAAARLVLYFDREHVDSTRLEADVDVGDCAVQGEPIYADVRRLARPFEHVFPDGTRAVVGAARGNYARLGLLPRHVTGAFLAAEDARFFHHRGFDLDQIERSLAIDLGHETLLRGGSSISQQLVKNVFLSPERTLARKFQEAVLTWRLEHHLGKRLILERYLNVIELGPGVFGLSAAAQHWFGKPPQDLTAVEAAFLATLTRAPNGIGRQISEHRDKLERLDDRTRRQVQSVLRSMRQLGIVDRATYDRAQRHLHAEKQPVAKVPL